MSAFWSIEVSSQLTLIKKFCPMPPAGHQRTDQLLAGQREALCAQLTDGAHPLL